MNSEANCRLSHITSCEASGLVQHHRATLFEVYTDSSVVHVDLVHVQETLRLLSTSLSQRYSCSPQLAQFFLLLCSGVVIWRRDRLQSARRYWRNRDAGLP